MTNFHSEFIVPNSLLQLTIRSRGVDGLTCLPVTQKIAGSNPVGTAKLKQSKTDQHYNADRFLILCLFSPDLANLQKCEKSPCSGKSIGL